MNPKQYGDENTQRVVAALLDFFADPAALETLRKFRNRAREIKREELEPEFELREARKGTCPKCGRKYAINRKMRTLRRHGKGVCLSTDMLPAELTQAIWVIADMGSSDGNGNCEG